MEKKRKTFLTIIILFLFHGFLNSEPIVMAIIEGLVFQLSCCLQAVKVITIGFYRCADLIWGSGLTQGHPTPLGADPGQQDSRPAGQARFLQLPWGTDQGKDTGATPSPLLPTHPLPTPTLQNGPPRHNETKGRLFPSTLTYMLAPV